MDAAPKYRILLVSTAVAPLGTGLGGGVELFVKNAVQGLQQRGHRVTVVAPAQSQLENCDRLVHIDGQLQPTAHTSDRETPIVMPQSSVLSGMMAYAQQVQADYDVLLHFCYDWLPFYLTLVLSNPDRALRQHGFVDRRHGRGDCASDHAVSRHGGGVYPGASGDIAPG
jgi:UDP-glucose:tetrahydrobiopterin glucosyltransferase